MEVFVADEQDLPVDHRRVSELAQHTLAEENVDASAELSVLFVTAGHIRRLNSHFAENDYATDVLAFPMMEDEESSLLLGDVVVCPAVAERNAQRAGHSLADEIAVLVVHGTLHLLGYDHQEKEDGRRMTQRQREIIDSFRAGVS